MFVNFAVKKITDKTKIKCDNTFTVNFNENNSCEIYEHSIALNDFNNYPHLEFELPNLVLIVEILCWANKRGNDIILFIYFFTNFLK